MKEKLNLHNRPPLEVGIQALGLTSKGVGLPCKSPPPSVSIDLTSSEILTFIGKSMGQNAQAVNSFGHVSKSIQNSFLRPQLSPNFFFRVDTGEE